MPSSLIQFPSLLAIYLRQRSNQQNVDINPLFHLYFQLPSLSDLQQLHIVSSDSRGFEPFHDTKNEFLHLSEVV